MHPFADQFMPHGTCYLWNPGVLWLNVISDGLIALSYYAIPFVLFSFARRRRDIAFKWVFIAFGAFILACGTTHALGVWTVWHADYWLDGAVKAVTAASSMVTAALLVPLVPTLIRLPSPSQLARVNIALEREVMERKGAEEAVRLLNTELEERVTRRTAELLESNEQLRQSFDRYRFLADAMPQIVWTARPDGEIDYLNRRWYEYSGAPAGSLAWFDEVHPDDLPALRSLWQETLARTAMLELEVRLRDSQGRFRWHLVRALPMRGPDRQVREWVATSTDIDDQKQTEQKLRAAHHELETIVDTAPLAIYSVNDSGRVTSWSRSAESLFGFSVEETVGRIPPFISTDRERSEFSESMAFLLRGQAVAGRELRRRRKDGTPLQVGLWAAPLRSDAGKVSGAICMMADITERKRLEGQLLQSQKMEAIGRLAGGVAHDFNNLLTVITGFNEMVLQDLSEPRLLEYAKEVRNAADRAADLTGQLLAFGRRQMIQPRRLNLNDVVRRADKMLRRIIGEDVELTTREAPDLGDINADPGQIDQVILNLAVNARDAMPKGGKLTIETANVDLSPEYAGRHIGVEPGPYVILAVSDTGAGMDAETQRRLFEPFFTTKPPGEGTGLGLSIVYGIVKQHRGDILVCSEPEKGTVFKIYFPRIGPPEEQERPAGAAHAAAVKGTETILVVEDAVGVLRLVENMLSKQGYRILAANSPDEARRLFEERREEIDLLLSDVVMPGSNGVELARELGARRPGLKVLFMSGYTSTGVIQPALLEAGTAFIQKPFTSTALTQKVREVLGGVS